MKNKFSFNTAQMTKMPRSRFKLSQNIKTTFNVGKLIPFFVQEILPGDTFKLNTSAILRTSTVLKPVMDNLILDYYYFYVPNRIMFNEWKNLMGESVDAWDDANSYQNPTIKLWDDYAAVLNVGSVGDYLGIPPADYSQGLGADCEDGLTINSLPFRAYSLIYNEWFRDQNLIDPLLILYDDDVTQDMAIMSGSPLNAAKYHDYFTSCLPSPQKGDSVYIPWDDVLLPVIAKSSEHNNAVGGVSPVPVVVEDSSSGNKPGANVTLGAVTTTGALGYITNSPTLAATSQTFANLWADSNVTGSVIGSPTINALRLAFQVQKIYEKDARGGSRYVEILKSHFGVISPDARQQRPEFLGGGSQVLGIQQVPQTAGTTDGSSLGVGNVSAYSFTGHTKHTFEKSFTEHGFILGICVVRWKPTYAQGIAKFWNRLTRFDYYDPSLAHIGEQPVRKTELAASNFTDLDNEVFGYQEAWADYRYNPNRVSGLFRPYVAGNIAIWNYADDISGEPTLNQAFIEVDETTIDRTLAVASTVTDQIIADIYLDITATRPMPLFSVPGLIDHF